MGFEVGTSPFAGARPAMAPPGLPLQKKALDTVRLMQVFFKNNLAVYAPEAFEELFLRSRVLGRETVLINDPAGIRHMFGPGASSYRRPVAGLRVSRPITGSGVFTSEGESWRRQRRTLASAFTPAAVGLMLPHFQRAAENLVARLQDRGAVDLAEAFHATALDAVLRSLFSAPEGDERDRLSALVGQFLRGPGRLQLLDGIASSEEDFGWAQASRRHFGRQWAQAVDALIAARRSSRGEHHDLLDLLLAARDPATGDPLPDAEIRDQCGTMLFAGHETTARLLFWSCYLLCLDQDEQARLRSETGDFNPAGIKRLSDLEHWPRHRLVLLEALRLYPPLPNLVRDAIEDTAIGDEPIRKGTMIWIVPYVLHRHRRFWEHPLEFRPDRFENRPAPWVDGPFMPFGSGPRICIGASFAMAEAQIILGTLLSRFRLTLAGSRPVLPVGRITLVPDHNPMFTLHAH